MGGSCGAHWHSNVSRLLCGDLAVHIGTVMSLCYCLEILRYTMAQ